MISKLRAGAVALAVVLFAGGCSSSKGSPPQTQAAPTGECTKCHGGPADSAPPRATTGATATTDLRVGAHQSHLGPGLYRKPIACAECHVVPETVTAPGHNDGKADVSFDPTRLARAGGAAARWDAPTATCVTYCHGATLAGGAHTSTVWTLVDGSQVRCGSCHGEPPATVRGGRAAHPTVTGGPAACAPCHPGTVGTDGRILAGGGQHIDGVVQIGGVACTGCHGDPTREASISPAPPRDTHGATSTTAIGVGAHARHLVDKNFRAAAIDCAECHETRDTLSRHPDGAVDLDFGPLARAGGAVARWDAASQTCVTYCHGATLAGGPARTPSWTSVGPGPMACSGCHGMPPPLPHAQDAACGKCHSGYSTTAPSTIVNKTLHLDGYVELDLKTCSSCHGDATRAPGLQAAPPIDVRGNTATTVLGVGAHQVHLTGTTLAAPVKCSECHPAVTKTNHAVGQGFVRAMDFGPLASAAGTHPTWDRTTATCASTYCHGATLQGGKATAPIWTRVDGTQKRCDSCHGIPPSAPHPDRIDCGTCHAGYTSTQVVPATHIDGLVQADSATCTSCHGDANRQPATIAAAPPLDMNAEYWVTARGVGAHQRHLVAGNVARAMACGECHLVPTNVGHANLRVEVTFGPLSVTSATPVWDGARCSNVYCHGATLAGGTVKAPVWTKVDGTQAACGTCHGIPPPAPHTQSRACGGCHTGYTETTVDLARHLDGVVQATGSCTACHGDRAAPATDAFAAAPPLDAHGNGTTTAVGVGAHRAHVETTALRVGLACTECHPATNAATHPEGTPTATVLFGPLASGGGLTPVWNRTGCASVYCHGASMGATTPPIWTQVDGTFAACTSCHGIPPTSHAAYPSNQQCGNCHKGYTATTVDPTTHVDGVVNAAGAGSCTFCHGDATRTGAAAAAPPTDTLKNTSTASRGVGAHQIHLQGGPLRVAIPCSECHVSPPASPHPSRSVELAFGSLASTGTTATWNGTALTCANYCHGATLTGGRLKAPVWNTVNGTQAACGTCHGVPPPKPHLQRTDCGSCHPGSTSTTVDPTTHVDGQVQTIPLSCTTCHGDAKRVLVTGADARTQSAPPVDTAGASTATLRSVGAHLAHLNRGTGAIAAPTACSECHVVPASNTHADGVATVTFGTRAKTNGAAPTWNGATCASTYCHGTGNLVLGVEFGARSAPSWTATGPLACFGSCHAKPTDQYHNGTFVHENQNGACNGCHKDTDATGSRITNPSLHVNGVVDGLCSQCHRGKTP